MVLKYVPFFLRFLGRPERSTGWAHMQSVHAGAVQTHFSDFALFLKNSFQKTSVWVHLRVNVGSKCDICVKKASPKMLQKKCPTKGKQGTIRRSGGSRRSSLACALLRQETIVRATIEALFEILAEKSELDSKSLQTTEWFAENMKSMLEKLQQTLKQLLKQLLKQVRQADDLTRPGQGPANYRGTTTTHK